MNFLGGGVLNAAMLVGLAGVAIPLAIHFLNRRADPIVDWGAMQFLQFSPRERRRLNLAEILLMLARMALLALVALALARPFWTARPASASNVTESATTAGSGPRRDVVLILDGSDSMGRVSAGTSPRDDTIAWARAFVKRLKPGDSVALLEARDRVIERLVPPSFDLEGVDRALAGLPPPRGSSDLPAAVAEGLRILEATRNPARELILLSDLQRTAWKPGDAGRWSLLRDLRRRMPTPPRIWIPEFPRTDDTDTPDGSVGPIELSRGLLTPNLPVDVTAAIANAGPGPLTRNVELELDGKPVPGSSKSVGPIPAGGKAPVSFRVKFDRAGSHLVTVKLASGSGGDPLAVNDESARPVTVAPVLPALLVDGEPGLEPFSGEVDFLRAALAPTGDETPLVQATTIPARELRADRLRGIRVVVLANLDRVPGDVAPALAAFVETGGGLLIAPGDRLDPASWAMPAVQTWLPVRFGPLKGDPGARQAVAHPAPGTFEGPALGPLKQGNAPALAQADLFHYRVLEPLTGAVVTARLDTGDPWVVERGWGKGRVAVLAGPVDAEGGTLPVNPDFVPWAHELVAHLASGSGAAEALRPGEPLRFDLDPLTPPTLKSLTLTTPTGTARQVPIARDGSSASVRVTDTGEAGIYRLTLPDPPGGYAYAAVAGDGGEADPALLEPGEAKSLAEGWPMVFEPDAARCADRILAVERVRRSELWQPLILAALGGLCLEIWLTRRIARGQAVFADA